MPLRTIASFAVALFLGAIAVLLIRSVLSSKQPAHSLLTTPVVVATAPIASGSELKPAMVKVVDYPATAVPAGSFRSPDELFGRNAPQRMVQRQIGLNEPILLDKLNGPGARTTILSAVIQPGMRAVSLRASDVTGVGGFVLPGDRVDVLMTRTIGNGPNSKSVTQVLAENAVVLGVDQTSDQTADKPIVAKAVTIQVSPPQAQAISLAENVGQLSLTLRQVADNAPLVKRVTTEADLGPAGTVGPVRRVHHVASKPFTLVRVVRGVDATPYPVSGY